MIPKRPQFLRPSSGSWNVNQKAPTFGDRRTKRERDRSSKKRHAIDRSKHE